MAGRLLFVIVMCSFHEIQAQALPPPTLTVNQPVITEKDSVTLNCQTPSSVSVSQCYFRVVRNSQDKLLPCLSTFRATELLLMAQQTSPAEVKLMCFYVENNYASPESDVSSINIITLPPPTLTVNPAVITETDSVTLKCQTPSSVSVSKCNFEIVGRDTTRVFSCVKTLTGTELLLMARQSSPAEVKVKCFYTVKLGDSDSPSLHSDTSSINIHIPGEKPQMSGQFYDDQIVFTCSLPGSANSDTICYLYFGETSRPVLTTTIWKTSSSNKQWFCLFTVTVDDFLRHVCFVQQKDASCDYSLGSEHNSLSPRSDGYSLTDTVKRESLLADCTKSAFTMTTDIVEVESQTTQTMSTSRLTTVLTVTRTLTSNPVTPVKPASGNKIIDGFYVIFVNHKVDGIVVYIATCCSDSTNSFPHMKLTGPNPFSSVVNIVETESHTTQTMSMSTVTTGLTVSRPHTSTSETDKKETNTWSFLVVVIGGSVGVISLGLALLCIKRRRVRCSHKRAQASITDDLMCMRDLDHGGLLPAGNDETYNVISSVPGADGPPGSKKLNGLEPQYMDSDIYHVYSTISEEPSASARKEMVYSTLQAH